MSNEESVVAKQLSEAQAELHVSKGKATARYTFRSAEDIFKAAKPICRKHGLVLNVSDEVVSIEGWHYVTATARVIAIGTGETIEAKGYAREIEATQGMGAAQITGSASSYARKYALCGLFCLDDNKDVDTIEYWRGVALPQIVMAQTRAELTQIWNMYPVLKNDEITRRAAALVGNTFEVKRQTKGTDIVKSAMQTK